MTVYHILVHVKQRAALHMYLSTMTWINTYKTFTSYVKLMKLQRDARNKPNLCVQSYQKIKDTKVKGNKKKIWNISYSG